VSSGFQGSRRKSWRWGSFWEQNNILYDSKSKQTSYTDSSHITW